MVSVLVRMRLPALSEETLAWSSASSEDNVDNVA